MKECGNCPTRSVSGSSARWASLSQNGQGPAMRRVQKKPAGCNRRAFVRSIAAAEGATAHAAAVGQFVVAAGRGHQPGEQPDHHQEHRRKPGEAEKLHEPTPHWEKN